MFGDINRVTLMGNITKDPDLRFTPGGAAVLNFSIATNRNYKQGEEWKEEVAFHNIVCWRNAESLAKRIKKGTRIYVEGRLQTRSWDGEDGKKQYKTEVVSDNVILIARYEGEGQGGGNYSTSEANEGEVPAPKKQANKKTEETMIEPDDLPF